MEDSNGRFELLRLVMDESWDEAMDLVSRTTSQEEIRRLAVTPDQDGFVALDLVCDETCRMIASAEELLVLLLEKNPQLLNVVFSDGLMPLERLVWWVSIKTLRMMLEMMLENTMMKEKLVKLHRVYTRRNGEFCSRNVYTNALVELCGDDCMGRYILESHSLLVRGEEQTTDNTNWTRCADFWTRLILMLTALYYGTLCTSHLDETRFDYIHACAGIAHCPPHLLRLVTVAFPQELRKEDVKGDLPIHVAAASSFPFGMKFESGRMGEAVDEDAIKRNEASASSGDQGQVGETPDEENDTVDNIADPTNNIHVCGTMKTTMDILVQADPDSARICNRSGRLPLHLAIESGREWDSGIDTLLEAYPEAIDMKDNKTGLFPFMLAAADSTSSLTTVYQIVRACPDSKNYTIHDDQSRHEDHALPQAKRTRRE